MSTVEVIADRPDIAGTYRRHPGEVIGADRSGGGAGAEAGGGAGGGVGLAPRRRSNCCRSNARSASGWRCRCSSTRRPRHRRHSPPPHRRGSCCCPGWGWGRCSNCCRPNARQGQVGRTVIGNADRPDIVGGHRRHIVEVEVVGALVRAGDDAPGAAVPMLDERLGGGVASW